MIYETCGDKIERKIKFGYNTPARKFEATKMNSIITSSKKCYVDFFTFFNLFYPPLKKIPSRAWLKAEQSKHPNLIKTSVFITLRSFILFLFAWTVLLSVILSAQTQDCPDPLPSGMICEVIKSNSGESDENINIEESEITIETTEDTAHGIWGIHLARGHINIVFSGESITTKGKRAYGIHGYLEGIGDINIKFSGGSITTEGYFAHGVVGDQRLTGTGNIDIDFTGGSIITKGENAHGIHVGLTNNGEVDIDFTGGSIITKGENALGIYGNRSGIGNININFLGGSITTKGDDGHGIYSRHRGTGEINTIFSGGSISTIGKYAYGIAGVQGPSLGTGDINIDFTGGSITTTGENAYGIVGWYRDTDSGDVNIDFTGGSITTNGQNAHGIVGINQGTGDLYIMSGEGTNIMATGNEAYGIYASGSTNIIRIFGRVKGGKAGLNILGKGEVTIGPNGFVGSGDGVAIRADDILHVNLLSTNGKPWEHFGGRFDVSKPDTTLSVNRVVLLEREEFQDVWAPSGFHEVKLNPEFPHDTNSFDFSQEEAWLSRYGINAGLFEALPGAIRRIHMFSCGFTTNRQSSTSVCDGRGQYIPKRSDTGMSYSYNQNTFQTHISRPLSDQMTGWIGGRLVNGETKVTSARGQGQLKIKGSGLYGGVHLERDNGIYLQTQFSWSRYDAYLSPTPVEGDETTTNMTSANGEAYSLGIEAGKVWVLDNETQLMGLGWYHQAGASVDALGYSQLDNLVWGKDRQSKIGLGLRVSRTMELARDESYLELSGGIGLEHVLGQDSHATWSGTKISNAAKENRLLVDLGSDYYMGNHLVVGVDIFAHGLLSDDTIYGLKVGVIWSF